MNSDNITVRHKGETVELGAFQTWYVNQMTGETAKLVGAGYETRTEAVMFLIDADHTIHTVSLRSRMWTPLPEYFEA